MEEEASEPVRIRWGVGLLYALAVAANGVLVWFTIRDRPEVAAWREKIAAKLKGCQGCARRKALLIEEAQRIVGVVRD